MVQLKSTDEELHILAQNWANLRQKCCCSSSFLVIVLFSFCVVGLIFNLYDGFDNEDQYNSLEDDNLQTIQSPLSQEDPALIEYIGKRIEPPPKTGLNALDGHYKKKDRFSPSVIIMSFIYKYLTVELQAGGFYVEVGLSHGLSESNTLRLDMIYNWKGILVESNTESYNILRRTKRHAMTGNFCISPRPYSMYKAENQTLPSSKGRFLLQDKIECYPLLSVLSAIITKKTILVDFMSLSTGGTEFDIIKTLPKEIAIKLLYIDHRYIKNGFEDIHDYMEHRQYTWVHGVKENDTIVGSIFVHNYAFSRSF